MIIFYNLLYLIAVILYLPVFLLRGKFHSGTGVRFGMLPRRLKLDKPVWIHAVSVGEAVAVKGLLAELRLKFPDKKFVISTVTPTGNKIARGLAKEGDFVTYLPFDLSFIISGVMKRIDPCLFLVAETEIWPALFSVLHKRRVPIVVVNARISDSSLRGDLAVKPLISPVLNKVSLFCAQSEQDAERLLSLGLDKKKVKTTGNMKFDIGQASFSFSAPRLRLRLDEKLFVCGSTHPGEEEIIFSAYKELKGEYPDLRLLIAPRHPERAEEVASLARKAGLNSVLSSVYEQSQESASPVYIVDSVGELLSFYSIAHLVFVGGSLVGKGGHNILEPAALGKPVIFGPHMFNFRQITELFLLNSAALQVQDSQGLKEAVRSIMRQPSFAQELGERAKGLFKSNQGATLKNSELVSSFIGETEKTHA